MSKRNKISKENKYGGMSHLKEKTLHGIVAVALFVIAVFFVLSSINIGKRNLGGWAGIHTYDIFSQLFGIGYFLIPVILVILGISFFRSAQQKIAMLQSIGGLALFLSSLGIISTISYIISKSATGVGGVVGHWISLPLIGIFDVYVTVIFLIAIALISILVIFDVHLADLMWWKKDEEDEEENKEVSADLDASELKKMDDARKATEKEGADNDNKQKIKVATDAKNKQDEFTLSVPEHIKRASYNEFVPLPLSLLEGDKGKPGVGDIKANANIIKRTLQNFGISVEMDEVSIGPSITRYALKPAEGVKLSRIVALHNDLALALAAHPIRIEAPIPGKSLVGIEIPNSVKTTVGLANLIGDSEYQKSEKPLLVTLGKGISGKSYFANLGKMPHLLIAGATGSGKSVTIHAIITSLLYRNSPENLKFIMIDPKRVELTLYNKIPHLLTPVVTDAKKSILALKWAAKEMDRRYDILESESVRDIESYHKNILAPAVKKLSGEEKAEAEAAGKIPETLPYIVIVIDELADIMQAYPRELESAIVRLAQMSRAVGIHLILSTQRPSVNVITGLIKANVPARIALQVSSQIDSRTILDASGAEKLLGAGDMLFQSGDMSQPNRIQSAFISETELKNVVKFLVDHNDTIPEAGIDLTNQPQEKNSIFDAVNNNDEFSDDDDDLYEQAREEIIHAGKASTSYLQRKLRIGYARAARLMDMLEERGVIGAPDGSRPRDVITDKPNETTDTLPPTT
jgi:S-DNA-T family DNA segregation ATPase FtsK/SpoIIIE